MCCSARNGLIIDDSPFHPAVIEGVEEAAKANGMDTIFIRLNYGTPDFDLQVKNIISLTPTAASSCWPPRCQEEDFQLFRRCKSPLILLDGWSERYPFDGVLINNQDSARRAVEYLIEKGHRQIGYIRGSFRIKAFCAREQGYRPDPGGTRPAPESRVDRHRGHQDRVRLCGACCLAGAGPPAAHRLFARQRAEAFGVIRALKEMGQGPRGCVHRGL